MNRLNNIRLSGTKLFTVLAVAIFSTTSMAATPFPGKLPVTIVNIEAANIILVNLETWPGFRRDFRITLPNLVLPGQGEEVKECELELAKSAHDFAVNFLSDVTTVHVQDMEMENSAALDAISSIYTNKGTLDNALRREKLAKPAASVHNEPWCE